MKRFYFDIREGDEIIPDEEGLEPSRAYHEERMRRLDEEAEADCVKADLAELDRLRRHLIFGRQVGGLFHSSSALVVPSVQPGAVSRHLLDVVGRNGGISFSRSPPRRA
jgi:hypothetical protein